MAMNNPNGTASAGRGGGGTTTYDVSELVGMGYTHKDSQLAMQVAHGDLSQAISFLLLGDSSRMGFCYQPSDREFVVGSTGADESTLINTAMPSSSDTAAHVTLAASLSSAAATAAAARRHDNSGLHSIGEMGASERDDDDDDGPNQSIKALIQMGYSADDSKHALAKCNGDVYEAIEYLLVNRSDRKLPADEDETSHEESDRKLPAAGGAKPQPKDPPQSNLKPPPPAPAPSPSPDGNTKPTQYSSDTVDINDEDAAFAFALQQQEEENQKLVEAEAERERLKQQMQQTQTQQGDFLQSPVSSNAVDEDVAFAMALQEQEQMNQVQQLQDQQRLQAHMLLMARTGAIGGVPPQQQVQQFQAPPTIPHQDRQASTGELYEHSTDQRPQQLHQQSRVRSVGDTPSGFEQQQQTQGRLPPPPVLLQMQQARQIQQLTRQYEEQDIDFELMAYNQIEDAQPASHQQQQSQQPPPPHAIPPSPGPPGSVGGPASRKMSPKQEYRPKSTPSNAQRPPGHEFDMFNDLGTVGAPGQPVASPKSSKATRKGRAHSPKPSSPRKSGQTGIGLREKLSTAVGAVGGSAAKVAGVAGQGAAKVAGVAGKGATKVAGVAGKGATKVAGAAGKSATAIAGVGVAAVAGVGGAVATAGSAVVNVSPNTPRMVVAKSSLLTIPVPDGAQESASVFCAVVAAAKFFHGGKVNADFLNSIMHEGVYTCAEALREQNSEHQKAVLSNVAGNPKESRNTFKDEWSVLRVLVKYGSQLGVAATEMDENPKQGIYLEKELNHPWGIRKTLTKCRNEQKGREWQILILETAAIRTRDCVCVCLPPKGTMNKFWCLDMKPRACFRAPLGAYARAHTNMVQLVESLEGILKSMVIEGMDDRRKHPKQFYSYGMGDHPDGDHEPFSVYTIRKV